jgi:hypothetical protein
MRLRDVERKLADLRSDGGAPPEQRTSRARAKLPTLQDRLADESGRHAAWTSNYEAEFRDAVWANTTSSMLSQDLTRLAEQTGFTAGDVDCRTTRCRVRVEWPSYDEARKKAASLATANYGVNCSKHVFYPPPDDPSVPYSMTLDFDCEDSRAAQLN